MNRQEEPEWDPMTVGFIVYVVCTPWLFLGAEVLVNLLNR